MSKHKISDEKIFYENKKIYLSRDSKNWIVNFKSNQKQKYFFFDPNCMFVYLINEHLTSDIIERGLDGLLNTLDKLYRDAKLELSTVTDGIAQLIKTLEDKDEPIEEVQDNGNKKRVPTPRKRKIQKK